MNPAVISKNQL